MPSVISSRRQLVAHLYRRAGFGRTADELDEAEAKGFDACLEELLAGLDPAADVSTPPPPGLTPLRYVKQSTDLWGEFIELVNWWIDTMVTATNPLREKLVLLLHNQFPTAFSKVAYASLLHTQNQIFRRIGPGRFDDLVRVVSKDPAMLLWLDANSDVAQDPNENFARELMERFTMGIGHYGQRDVHEAARCFCGWSLNWQTGDFEIAQWAVDGGLKTVLGHTGHLTGDDVIDIVTHHPATATFVTSRLWSWLAYPAGPDDPVVLELAAGFAKDLSIANLVASMLRHPTFLSPRAKNGLVKQPIEYVVGAMRALGLTAKQLGSRGTLDWFLANLGQEPFNPPNVGGWGENRYYLSTATAQFRLFFGGNLAGARRFGQLERADAKDRIALVQRLLGIESFAEPSLEALEQQTESLPALFMLALASPEYVVN